MVKTKKKEKINKKDDLKSVPQLYKSILNEKDLTDEQRSSMGVPLETDQGIALTQCVAYFQCSVPGIRCTWYCKVCGVGEDESQIDPLFPNTPPPPLPASELGKLVSCDGCDGWYHQKCLDYTSKKLLVYCPSCKWRKP
ncbi:hypothetical protein SNEBB_004187 [Seison nebaliae]|nr:hypothetical protein SNEBB_004187 [Seison nebaliae]